MKCSEHIELSYFCKDADDLDSIRFLDLLESVGVQQHIKHSTHVGGHTLDLIISRQIDRIILADPRGEQFLSDHRSILCFLQFEKPLLLQRLSHIENGNRLILKI